MAQDNLGATQPEGRPAQRSGIYYGWYLVAVAMFIAAVTTGARNGFGIFVIPMSETFDWNRTTISVAAAIGWLVNGVTQPFVGHLFDKFNSKQVILVSLVVAGFATAALSLTFHYLFLVFLFSFVLSTAMSGASMGTLAPLLSRWFLRRRTFVLGLMVAGTSLGGLILVPFSALIVEMFDWRASWITLGGFILLLSVPLGFFLLRNSPSEMGLLPDGAPDPPGSDRGKAPTRRQGLFEVDQWYKSFRSPPMWNLTASYTVCGWTVGLISIHFVPYAEEQIGVSTTMAGTIFGVMMGMNVVGAIGAGWLADRFGRKNVLASVYFTRGLAYLMLLGGLFAVERSITVPILGSPGVPSLWVFAFIAGFSWIASVPVTTSLTADVYGLRALATITGISFLGHQVGAFISILTAGILYDATGSYFLPFAIAGALLLPASISAYLINERKYSVRYQLETAPAAAD